MQTRWVMAWGREAVINGGSMPADSRLFQLRRVYLGYNYEISRKLSAEILLAAEDDVYPGSVGNQTNNGDVLSDNKLAPYLKLANIRWKNIFRGTDLVFGQVATPAFPLLTGTGLGVPFYRKDNSRHTPYPFLRSWRYLARPFWPGCKLRV